MATASSEGRREPAEETPRVGVLADPGAWAVTAFATTSFMLGWYNAGEISSASLPLVFPMAFFFGGLVQIIVACFEMGRGNVFGAVVFGTYGPFWVIFGAIETWFVPKVHPAAAANQGVALFLAMFAVVSFYFWIASFRTDAVLVVIILLIWIGLGLLAWEFAAGNTNLIKAGGWVTVAFAVIAWYHAAADLINFTFRRPVLPLFPIGTDANSPLSVSDPSGPASLVVKYPQIRR